MVHVTCYIQTKFTALQYMCRFLYRTTTYSGNVPHPFIVTEKKGDQVYAFIENLLDILTLHLLKNGMS